jgi:hypothetical protein
MKKASFLLGGLFLMLVSTSTYAQSKPGLTYFVGKWNVLIKGTPNGDARMIFDLQTRNDSLTGVVRDSTGKEFSKISSVELTDTSATVHFTAQDYEVYLVMNKKDNDNITGNMMGMFDAEGKRIKNPQQN